MGIQARVTSTEALETFRIALLLFLEKAHRSVDNVTDDVRRTRSWLQNDGMSHWLGEVRRATKAVDQAKQELMTARLNTHSDAAMMARRSAVAKAERALAEAEDKLRKIKKWNQNFDNCVDPFVKKLNSLSQFLSEDLPKAKAYLANLQRTLDEYAHGAGPPSASTDAPPLAEPAPETTSPT